MAETGDTHRTVSLEDEDGTRHIAVLRRSAENDQISDEDIIAELKAWRTNRRHLHAGDDE